MKGIKPNSMLATVFWLISSYHDAQAALTAETVNGANLVYDSGINAAWAANANLLGTMESSAIAQYGSDISVINAIIAANAGVVHDAPDLFDNGTYTLSASDFNANGQGTADLWGAEAFVRYLNSIHYAGTANWSLPSTPNQEGGYNISASQLGELFYTELDGSAYYDIPGNSFFSNYQFHMFWLGTQNASSSNYEWYFYTGDGDQNTGYKNLQMYTWAVVSGNVTSIPVPGAFWLFAAGIAGYFGLSKRKGRKQSV